MSKSRIKRKIEKNNYNKFAMKICVSEELKQDSIAHLVKSYFEFDNIHNRELFDFKDNKILVSKKALKHIINICDSLLLESNVDFEFVDSLKVIKNEK